jgi:hypothetical protein
MSQPANMKKEALMNIGSETESVFSLSRSLPLLPSSRNPQLIVSLVPVCQPHPLSPKASPPVHLSPTTNGSNLAINSLNLIVRSASPPVHSSSTPPFAEALSSAKGEKKHNSFGWEG